MNEYLQSFCLTNDEGRRKKISELIETKGLTNQDIELILSGISVKPEIEPISFKEYLEIMVGKKKAQEILSMNRTRREDTFIIVTGRQGPTGKTSFCQILNNHGYRALELYEQVTVELNTEIQQQTPRFSRFVV